LIRGPFVGKTMWRTMPFAASPSSSERSFSLIGMANGHGHELKFDRQLFGRVAVDAGHGHDGDLLSRRDWAFFAEEVVEPGSRKGYDFLQV
jgi:hypothetical protein